MRALWLGVLAMAACGGGGGGSDGGGPPVDAAWADGRPGDPPPAQTCTQPVSYYDTSAPTTVIGTGTPESCTEAALRAATQTGGVTTFDCGPDPVTIAITETLELPVDRSNIIDGGGLVTLDGGGATRIFHFEHPDWMNNPTIVALQRLTFRNGAAPAGTYFPQDPDNPNCAYGYKEGSGGVIYMRNGVLHVIGSQFYDNRAALVGPDVGGGAIYVLGVPELIVEDSVFSGNRGSNGGAIGLLFAGNAAIVNSVFEDDTAEGTGANYVEPGCPTFNHDEQGGAGGNGGGVVFDGLNDDTSVYTLCGDVFRSDRANELGGALFRTPNAGVRQMRIDRCLFDGNTARLGGVSFIKQNDVTALASTFTGNRSGLDIDGNVVGGVNGGLWINEGTLAMDNCTFWDNQPTGLDVDGTGTVANTTFVDNRLNGDLTVSNSVFDDVDCSSALAGAHNVQRTGTACAGDTMFIDPGLGELGDHGGPTPTFLPTGAITGLGADCSATDQRGEPRGTATCTPGSVEPGP
ncbi:MAG TPA: hypothetical protein VL172_08355 [Kofleriaceae bacterium]|nr:hypothetical protein [Kofleriaceae bacterium]